MLDGCVKIERAGIIAAGFGGVALAAFVAEELAVCGAATAAVAANVSPDRIVMSFFIGLRNWV